MDLLKPSRLGLLITGLLVVRYLARWLLVKKPPLPPGPRGLPIVGNMFDLPPPGQPEYQHWLGFKDRHGPISSIKILGQPMIIINDARIANELLEKRSAIYSSRMQLYFAHKMCGWGEFLANLEYNDLFRAMRKDLHSVLGTKFSVSRYHDVISIESRRFLWRTFQRPKDLVENLKMEAGASNLKISYGYTTEPHKNDALVDLANQALADFADAALPGKWLVDNLPFIDNFPDWFPGMAFKQIARGHRKNAFAAVEYPYGFARNQMANGKDTSSIVSDLLAKETDHTPEVEQRIKNSAGALYLGGADTTVGTLEWFFAAMLKYPAVQRQAQEEIDRVIGASRLPNLEDRENLPYIDAVVKEVYRWGTMIPICFPHKTSEDDIFEGYFIPKGSLILANSWWLLHDPQTYTDPSTFNPSRFLGPHPEADRSSMAFGYGRRRCPGMIIADVSVWLTVAQSLAVFDIGMLNQSKETVGKGVAEGTPGFLCHPIFPSQEFTIKARSQDAEELIRAIVVDHPWEKSDSEMLPRGL